jgi:hypothetical protein
MGWTEADEEASPTSQLAGGGERRIAGLRARAGAMRAPTAYGASDGGGVLPQFVHRRLVRFLAATD